jgi:CheY-like chemotaxis protein
MNICDQYNDFISKHNDYLNLNNSNKILLIDNDNDVSLTLKLLLNNCGFEVSVFNDYEEALNHFIINSRSYDIIICDLHNSFITAYDMLRRMRKINPEITIFVTTTSSFEDLIEESEVVINRSSYLDVDGIISKPIPQYELCKIVKNNSK